LAKDYKMANSGIPGEDDEKARDISYGSSGITGLDHG
jgi:hypothetical protein